MLCVFHQFGPSMSPLCESCKTQVRPSCQRQLEIRRLSKSVLTHQDIALQA